MMKVPLALIRLAACAAVLLGLAACSNFNGNPLSDADNPDFQAGKRRKGSMDLDGAIDSFERVLQTNPTSGQAHFELGLLCEQHLGDYASAIYHFQKFLKLEPESNLSEMVQARVNSCKVELAKTVSFSMVSKKAFAEMTRLATENTQLREQVMQLNMRLAAVPPPPSNAALRVAAVEATPVPQVSAPGVSAPVVPTPTTQTPAQTSPQSPVTSNPRTYTIKAGDNLYRLSKQFSVSFTAIKSANPSVVPERLKVGQVINLPSARN
jgi:tetratricopeptide (TPR) repeat protein